jgi:TolA-binding protein
LPSSPTTAQAHYFSAACYRDLGDYAKAIEYYETVVDLWPDYEYAWNAQFLIGHSYEHLRNAGAVPVAEANPRIKAAYDQVVQKYPDCPAARAARNWLSNPVNCRCTDQGGQK